MGVPRLPIVIFQAAAVDTIPENEAGNKEVNTIVVETIDRFVSALTKALDTDRALGAKTDYLTYQGKDYAEALSNMEKDFYVNRWSDGFPLVPPTDDLINKMLEGTDLPPDKVIGVLGPGNRIATVKKVAVNAAMAGCLPQYMPIVVAAVQALADPRADLGGCQNTTGACMPMLIVSGPKTITELNLNYGFSTMGPGWKANSTIGRAVRLILINIGGAWPGVNDMKPLGGPNKFVDVVAENEEEYQGAKGWDPIRVAEGFKQEETTVSIMPAASVRITAGTTITSTIDAFASQMQNSYNNHDTVWGEENLVIFSPTGFDVVRRAGLTREDMQKAIYAKAVVPCSEFSPNLVKGVPVSQIMGGTDLTAEVVEKCKGHPEAKVPTIPLATDLRIMVAGGRSTQLNGIVDTWGFGKAHFVTKGVQFPKAWNALLTKYAGWEIPVIH